MSQDRRKSTGGEGDATAVSPSHDLPECLVTAAKNTTHAPPKRRRKRSTKKNAALRWTQEPKDDVIRLLPMTLAEGAEEKEERPRLIAAYSYVPCNTITKGIVDYTLQRAIEANLDRVNIVGKMSVHAATVLRRRGEEEEEGRMPPGGIPKTSGPNVVFEVTYAVVTLEDARKLTARADLIYRNQGSPDKGIDQSLEVHERGSKSLATDEILLSDELVRALVRPGVADEGGGSGVPSPRIFLFACKYEDNPVVYATSIHMIVLLLLQLVGSGTTYEVTKTSNSKAMYTLFKNQVMVHPELPYPPRGDGDGDGDAVCVNHLLKWQTRDTAVDGINIASVPYTALRGKRTNTNNQKLDQFFQKTPAKSAAIEMQVSQTASVKGASTATTFDDSVDDTDDEDEEEYESMTTEELDGGNTAATTTLLSSSDVSTTTPMYTPATTATPPSTSYRTPLSKGGSAPASISRSSVKTPALTNEQVKAARRGKRPFSEVYAGGSAHSPPDKKRRSSGLAAARERTLPAEASEVLSEDFMDIELDGGSPFDEDREFFDAAMRSSGNLPRHSTEVWGVRSRGPRVMYSEADRLEVLEEITNALASTVRALSCLTRR